MAGQRGFVYLLLEHKRSPKRFTALQLLRYMVQIWEKVLAQGIGTESLLPIMPVVLYQGDTPWPYGETFQQLFHLPAPLAPYTPELPMLEEKFMPTLAEKWLEQGRQEIRAEMTTLTEKWLEAGERRVLLRQLELRFGSLPEEYRERMATADPDTLLVWSERVLSAHQLEEIFAP